jgi:glycosyltransferase involved in cell wall biosynthesis
MSSSRGRAVAGRPVRVGVMLRPINEKFGIGMFTRNLVSALLERDRVNEYVLFYRAAEDIGRFAPGPNVREEVVKAPSKALWDQVAIPAAAARAGVDVIFHTKFTVPFTTRARTVMIAHGASWFTHPELYPRHDVLYIRALMPLYCRRADAILSNSQLTTDDFQRILGVPETKLHTIWAAADTLFRPVTDAAALQAVRDRYRLPARFLLTVGRYDPRKNVETLIDAFARSGARENGVRLVIVGQGSEQYRSVCRLAERGLDESVVFTGYVPQTDLPAIYSMAEAFLFPSVYEEFGIPLCEAMACGCPIVASNTGAIPEITAGAAVLESPFDAAAMARGIDRILNDASFRQGLVARGSRRSAEFTWDRCAATTQAVLEGVARGKAAGPVVTPSS